MFYITIIMALIGNIQFDKTELNHTWILSDVTPKGWHASKGKVDILKFTDDSMIEMINIDQDQIRKVKYTLNNDNEIILESGVNFGQIKSVTKNQLVIQNGNEDAKTERIFSILPDTKLEISEAEILQEIKNHKWTAQVERPNNKENMIWTIEAASDDNFDILLIFSAKNKKIEMPGKLKKISNSFFLNYQITIYSASETLFISKIGEDEIQVSFGFGKENKTISFKKEE